MNHYPDTRTGLHGGIANVLSKLLAVFSPFSSFHSGDQPILRGERDMERQEYRRGELLVELQLDRSPVQFWNASPICHDVIAIADRCSLSSQMQCFQ